MNKEEILERLPNKFKEFMKEKWALSKYLENFESEWGNSLDSKEIFDFSDLKYLMRGGFDWDSTKEGIEYWESLSILWDAYLEAQPKNQIQVINKSKNPLPKYQTKGAAGFDLSAHIPQNGLEELKGSCIFKGIGYYSRYRLEDGKYSIRVDRGDRVIIPTGLYFNIPEGYCGAVVSRSGLSANHGIIITNSPGIIDSDYRGEVKLIVTNTGNEIFEIRNGDRLAQMLIQKVEQFPMIEVDSFDDETERGENGFGSTGKS